ncbi:MAG: sigma-70 family RNA polymerase sigma factor [Chloroflexi bacterium]|nr:sigma-70 family RNA polymerase sigma factor [Chloroflexota bacterium]
MPSTQMPGVIPDNLSNISDPSMDEAALILESQRGDLDAFNRLVLVYQGPLYYTALHILGENELAADATQEAFISAFRNIKNYRGDSFKAWLMRIVTNACYDELRQKKRRPTVPLEPENEDGDEVESPHWLTDTNMSPEDTFLNSELKNALLYCLNRLPVNLRSVVELTDIQGMHYSEVSRAEHVPLGTIKSRLARARMSLRNRLQEFSELLPDSFRFEKEISQ